MVKYVVVYHVNKLKSNQLSNQKSKLDETNQTQIQSKETSHAKLYLLALLSVPQSFHLWLLPHSQSLSCKSKTTQNSCLNISPFLLCLILLSTLNLAFLLTNMPHLPGQRLPMTPKLPNSGHFSFLFSIQYICLLPY